MGNEMRLLVPQEKLALSSLKTFLLNFDKDCHIFEQTCLICFKPLKYEIPNNKTVKLKCKHSIHQLCYKKFNIALDPNNQKEESLTCPICYEDLKNSDRDKEMFCGLMCNQVLIYPILGFLNYKNPGKNFTWDYPVVKSTGDKSQFFDINSNSKRYKRKIKESETIEKKKQKDIQDKKKEEMSKEQDFIKRRRNLKEEIQNNIKNEENNLQIQLQNERMNQRRQNKEKFYQEINQNLIDKIKEEVLKEEKEKLMKQIISEEKEKMRNKYLEENKENFQKIMDDRVEKFKNEYMEEINKRIEDEKINLENEKNIEIQKLKDNDQNVINQTKEKFVEDCNKIVEYYNLKLRREIDKVKLQICLERVNVINKKK